MTVAVRVTASEPDMRHRIGSVTKTFTAVALLQQVGEGRIDLDTPVADHLPELVPEGAAH